jgi:hypothetical protein
LNFSLEYSIYKTLKMVSNSPRILLFQFIHSYIS